MAFDIEMIKKVYSNIVKNVDDVRGIVNKPLSLSEKILYSHLWSQTNKSYKRGKPQPRKKRTWKRKPSKK